MFRRPLPLYFKFQSLKMIAIYIVFIEGFFFYYSYANGQIYSFLTTATTYSNPLMWILASLMLRSVIKDINDYYGIDLNKFPLDMNLDKNIPPKMKDIFKDDNSFKTHRNNLIKYFNKPFINIASIIIAIISTIILHYIIVRGDENTALGLYDVPVYNNLTSILFNLIEYPIFDIWIISIVLSSFFWGIQIAKGISEIGDKEELLSMGSVKQYMLKIKNNIEHPGNFKLEEIQTSLRTLERKSRNIGVMATKISFMLVAIVFFFSTTMTFLTFQVNETAKDILVAFIFIFTPITLTICIYVFFIPQKNIHNLLKSIKITLLEILEIKLERSRLNFLLPQDEKDNNWQARKDKAEEYNILMKMINDVENLLTWPFRYRQLTQIILSAIGALLLPLTIAAMKSWIFN